MLGFPLQFDATTPRLCKSVLSSAREPAGGSFGCKVGVQAQVHSGEWFSRLRGILAKPLPPPTSSQSSLSSISHLLLYPLYPLYTVAG